jgi:putative phosphoribosyl transferase
MFQLCWLVLILNKLIGKFQLKIKNRESAGNILSETLKHILKKYTREDIVVIGLPRGGLIIAEIIATKLSCRLELMFARRLRAPQNEELAIGAVTEDGTAYLNEQTIKILGISRDYIINEISYQLEEIRHQIRNYVAEKKTFLESKDPNIRNKIVVIVDDGAATGSTIISAVRSLRKNVKPRRLIVAVPISPKGTVKLLKEEGIDHIEFIISPQDSSFGSIEQYYRNFNQITDSQVLNIIQKVMIH